MMLVLAIVGLIFVIASLLLGLGLCQAAARSSHWAAEYIEEQERRRCDASVPDTSSSRIIA